VTTASRASIAVAAVAALGALAAWRYLPARAATEEPIDDFVPVAGSTRQ
jgi:hypothetical protein